MPGGECGPTHLQELIEQTEGVRVGQVVIIQPVPKFADVTRIKLSPVVVAGLPVTLTTLPLQLLCSFSPQTVFKPAEKTQHFQVNAKSEMKPTYHQLHALQEIVNENTTDSRNNELKDVVESLFEQHDNGHLDEQVCQTTTRMAL